MWTLSTSTPREQLAALLGANPDLVTEIRDTLLGGAEESGEAPTVLATTFGGTSEGVPTVTQTRKSLKYEINAVDVSIEDGDVDEDSPKALVVCYLPPAMATKSIEVIIVAEGNQTAGRVVKARRRKSA